jgi:hypothetical protein
VISFPPNLAATGILGQSSTPGVHHFRSTSCPNALTKETSNGEGQKEFIYKCMVTHGESKNELFSPSLDSGLSFMFKKRKNWDEYDLLCIIKQPRAKHGPRNHYLRSCSVRQGVQRSHSREAIWFL